MIVVISRRKHKCFLIFHILCCKLNATHLIPEKSRQLAKEGSVASEPKAERRGGDNNGHLLRTQLEIIYTDSLKRKSSEDGSCKGGVR